MTLTLSGIVSLFIKESISVMSSLGPVGVFALMVLEGVGLPFPSEVIMVFAGFLSSGSLLMFVVYAIVGSVGGFLGNIILYYISRYGGRPIILFIGKYFGLREEHLILTERWFDSKGEWTVFFGRFVPGFRSYMSIPAGISGMKILKFSVLTFSGSFIWSTSLETGGYYLGKSWERILPVLTQIGVVLLILFVIGIGVFVYLSIRKRQNSGTS
ncbi:MAG: DedA family protein [Thermoplasmatales archaeon]